MKYLKTFNNSADYQAFKGGGGLYNPKYMFIEG